MSKVLEGGVGNVSGGRVDKSRESGVRDLEDVGLDESGECMGDIVAFRGLKKASSDDEDAFTRSCRVLDSKQKISR